MIGGDGIVLLVMTDGRQDCITRTLERFDEMVTGPITWRIIHDDSGDSAYRRWLAATYPDYELVTTPGRSGFGGAIRSAWRYLTDHATEPWVLHVEDDFLFTRPVDLGDLVALSEDQPHLAQVAFRRQAWGAEIPHGGFMGMAPDWYREHNDGKRSWVETVRNYTTNPSLYRRELCSTGWPDGQHSEGHFGFRLRERGLPWGVPGAEVRFGFWGSMAEGKDWVWHIGDVRVGTGY